MTKYSADELEGKFIVAFDTVCDGWQCVTGDDLEPFIYNSKEEAEEDAEEDDFVLPAAEYIHNRKYVYTSSGGQVTGESLIK